MTLTDPILAALQDQVACYSRLAKLAQAQHDHVQHSRTDELLEVLSQRQVVLDQVADLEQVLGPAKRQWAGFLQRLPSDQRETAESLLAETRSLLEAINQSDRNDTLVLQQRKMNLGRQINQASAARQVNRTYASAAYGSRPSSLVNIQQ